MFLYLLLFQAVFIKVCWLWTVYLQFQTGLQSHFLDKKSCNFWLGKLWTLLNYVLNFACKLPLCYVHRLYEMKVEDADEVNWEELSDIVG